MCIAERLRMYVHRFFRCSQSVSQRVYNVCVATCVQRVCHKTAITQCWRTCVASCVSMTACVCLNMRSGSRLHTVSNTVNTLGATLAANVTTLLTMQGVTQRSLGFTQGNLTATMTTLSNTQVDVGYLRGNVSISLNSLSANITSLDGQQTTTAGLVAQAQNNISSLATNLSTTTADLGSLRTALQASLGGLVYNVARPSTTVAGAYHRLAIWGLYNTRPLACRFCWVVRAEDTHSYRTSVRFVFE